VQRISRLNRVLRLSASTAAIAAASGPAMAQLAGGNTLGGMATRIAQDSLQWGSLYTVVAYLLGAALVIYGGYAIYAHSRNPNGQHKTHWGAIAILVAGLLFAFNKVGNFGAQTVTGSSATATGANSQVLTIQ
jgi:hypothetical protein